MRELTLVEGVGCANLAHGRLRLDVCFWRRGWVRSPWHTARGSRFGGGVEFKYNIYAALIGSFTHCMASEFQNTVA